MAGLITAFEPFGGAATNSSLQALKLLEGHELLVLPVSFRRAPLIALDAIERLQPDWVLCLGEAKTRPKPQLERIAVNLQHASSPDNDGYCPSRQPVIPGGPDGIFTRADVDALAEQTGMSVSNSAGLYVCNALYYTLLHRLRIPVLFVHLPADGENRTEMLKTLINLLEVNY